MLTRSWVAIWRQIGTTSILEPSKTLRFNIFPNPPAHHIHVEGIQEDLNITIWDASGKLIQEKQLITNGTMSMEHLTSGLYFLLIENGFGKGYSKLVIP